MATKKTEGDQDQAPATKNVKDVVTTQEVRYGKKTYRPGETIRNVDTETRKELLALGAIEE